MKLRKELYRKVDRDSRRGDETNVYTLHFDDSEGFYVVHYREKDIVRSSGGEFMGVNERETETEMSVSDFLEEAPYKAKEEFLDSVPQLFS